jgi:hypothetical protein
MAKYLIDNNVISSFFSNELPERAMNFIANLVDNTPNISIITQIEALSWVTRDKNKENLVIEFISDCKIYSITPEVVNECVKLRRSKKIKTPDAIIAATAIVNDLILITSDADFNNISNLVVIDPKNI